jgi:ribulose-phosphate 3-epimerase
VVEAGADVLHLDVMDGSFVPPITFGAEFVKAVRSSTTLPLDVHLMIVNPEQHLGAFADAGASSITVHQETCPHLHRTIQRIHDHGIKAGVALNPGTPVSALADVIDALDLLLIMSVNPGWGGQSYIPHSTRKLVEAAALIKQSKRSIVLEVDGGINEHTAKTAVSAGAELLVAGSAIFQHKGRYAAAIAAIKGSNQPA